MLRKALLSLFLTAALAAPAMAQEAAVTDTGGTLTPPTIKLGIGYANAFDEEDNSTDFKVDLRSNWGWLGMIDPFVAFEANTDGGLFGGVGLTGDVHLTPQWLIIPSFAGGFYEEGNSVDLGGTAQFRSGIELAYQFPTAGRVGIELTHMSNFGMYDDNPGTEVVSLNYHMPLDILDGRK